jgi:hypothetical protein
LLYSGGPLGGIFPCPRHNSHFPEPWQAPQSTVRFRRGQELGTWRSPLPPHLLQRPVPLQKGHVVVSPSTAVPRSPWLSYYAPAEYHMGG